MIVGGIIAFLIALLAALAFALGWIGLEIFVMLLGLAGFGGLVGLRNAILSSGYKTWIIIGGGILISFGVGLGLITIEMATLLLAVLGIGSLPTIGHALLKAQAKTSVTYPDVVKH